MDDFMAGAWKALPTEPVSYTHLDVYKRQYIESFRDGTSSAFSRK